jgi:hypothetical protein
MSSDQRISRVIKHVTVDATGVDSRSSQNFDWLPALPLRWISLQIVFEATEINAPIAEAMADLPNKPVLHLLRFDRQSYYTVTSMPRVLDSLANSSALRRLHVQNMELRDDNVAPASLPTMPSIIRLSVNDVWL